MSDGGGAHAQHSGCGLEQCYPSTVAPCDVSLAIVRVTFSYSGFDADDGAALVMKRIRVERQNESAEVVQRCLDLALALPTHHAHAQLAVTVTHFPELCHDEESGLDDVCCDDPPPVLPYLCRALVTQPSGTIKTGSTGICRTDTAGSEREARVNSVP
ncbi:hypothetical protein B0A50_03505 [Salinomyces thailandicus]|uniref:Uncharacterized protein n=1 Tax=Salinomyces thailandicus TaxID=706561 RepID=A0A4U0U4N2_9PEZI|nr:hypothetical protein B0A50_03505 [Salinomyces thailandica]